MNMITKCNLLNPSEFQVLKVYLFREPMTGLYAYVYYLRPYSKSYNKSVTDDFDRQFYQWLLSMKLEQVQLLYSEDILFEGQKDLELKNFTRNKVEDKLCLRCHGDYTIEEIKANNGLEVIEIDMKVYWNARKDDFIFTQGGVFTFDKSKEKLFFGIFKSLKF